MGDRNAVTTKMSDMLEELGQDHRLVVAMTTIPPRLPRFEPVLDAMLNQEWPVSAVYVSIPRRYNRTGELYQIPPWLRAKEGVRILRCEDMGPGTHLLNVLRRELHPATFIVVVDDDHIYSPDLVHNLMRAALARPGSAVAAQGFLSVPGVDLMDKDKPPHLQDMGFAAGPVLVSYLGVVYQRGFFDDSVFDYRGYSRQCHYQDDMWFSAHLARKGIKRHVLGVAFRAKELKDLHLGPTSLTKWEENMPDLVNPQCNEALVRRHPDLWAYRRRVVLAVSGLPPFPADGFPRGSHLGFKTAELPLPAPASRVGAAAGGHEAWAAVADKLGPLAPQVDLIYLCSESEGEDASFLLGDSFWLGSLLVTRSDACRAFEPELRVTRLIRDPMAWEGDVNTVIVLGLLEDALLAAAQPERVGRVAECASRLEDSRESGQFCRQNKLLAGTVLGLAGPG